MAQAAQDACLEREISGMRDRLPWFEGEEYMKSVLI
jgi:hypothetical protein